MNPISLGALGALCACVLAVPGRSLAPQGTVSTPGGAVEVEPALLGWPGYARDPSHSANSAFPVNNLQSIHWSTPVDLQPQYSGADLLVHYGSPVLTPNGVLVLMVKTGANGNYRAEGRHARKGSLIWSAPTDYILAPHNWTPSVCCALTPTNQFVMPAAGGTILVRANAEQVASPLTRVAFFGLANYQANQAAYDNNVVIDTPITIDAAGNMYFGFLVLGPTPLNLQSGLARITPSGIGTYVAAGTVSGDPSIQKVVYNCAPALSQDGTSLYVAMNDAATSGFGTGYLVKLNSTTLAFQAKVRLKDVANPGNDALLPDDGTATPMVGPDGDVYFGVLENPLGANHYRGWMLHFNGGLTAAKPSGAFGWDDTPSVVPASSVPSYAGTSSYLILTKYNNYAGGGGTGLNKVAVLDPNATMIDPISGATTMNEVLTKLGPTPDNQYPGGVREWCINTAAVDPKRKCAIVNNEDGKVYRWDFVTNTLIEVLTLTTGIGEAYTPTVIGPDGVAYAINNARLYAVGR